MALAADLDARVKLSALADGFVEDPASAFPAGRLVRGRVVAIEDSRHDLWSTQVSLLLSCRNDGRAVPRQHDDASAIHRTNRSRLANAAAPLDMALLAVLCKPR